MDADPTDSHPFDPLRIGDGPAAYVSACLHSRDGGRTVCYRAEFDPAHTGRGVTR